MATRPARISTSEQTDARIGRRMKMSTISLFRLDRSAVADLLDARNDDALAWLQATPHHVVIADQFAQIHRTLIRDQCLSLRFRHVAEVLAVDSDDRGQRNQKAGGSLPDDPGS